MYTKQVNIASKFLIGLGLIFLGIFILNTATFSLQALSFLFAIAFLIAGVGNIISIVVEKLFSYELKTSLKMAVMNLGIGGVILLTPNLQISAFGILCGVYAIIIGGIRGINYIIYRKNQVHGRLVNLFLSIFFIVNGVLLMFSPFLRIEEVMTIIAIYFILYGLTYLRDGMGEMVPNHHRNRIKRKIRISLPVFLGALIPRSVLTEVNKYLEPSDTPLTSATPRFEQSKGDQHVDIEVFVHVSEDGYGAIGHVDLCLGEIVISYGNYDADSTKLFDTIGDGVLFKADKEAYVPFVIKESKKTLFGFGLSLSDAQKQDVDAKIAEIMSNVYEWTPPEYTGVDDYYATRMKHEVDVTYYKFKSGKFKTYFVAGTNCVLLADQIIGAAGLDILKINGIITPGTYYEYLNNQFAMRSSLVVTKNIYQ